MRTILRRPDIRLLFGGQFLSMFGDWAMFIALGVWARVLTGSNAEAGLVFLFLGLTGLVDALNRLPASDLRSLLMEVYRTRAAAVTEATIAAHAARDPLMAPSTA